MPQSRYNRGAFHVGVFMSVSSAPVLLAASFLVALTASMDALAAAASPPRPFKNVYDVSVKRFGPRDKGTPAITSSGAFVLDQRSGEVMYAKNAAVVTPIASLTKLMAAMVVLDAGSDMDEKITVGRHKVDTGKNAKARLPVGAEVSRRELLLLALMASENRAAQALASAHPGGMEAFVAAMNSKARALGMESARFVEPSGLSSGNVATARDVATMVAAADQYPIIGEMSTTRRTRIALGRKTLAFHNTNALVGSRHWRIGLSKTGYIHESGKCLVMQAWVAGRPLVMVFLDSWGKRTRLGDANRIKLWMERRTMLLAQAGTS